MSVSGTMRHLASLAHHRQPTPPSATHPFTGILAVLIGSIISTLYGRLGTFGLADIRGAVHAGFDEGAWITTASTTAQMFVAPIAVWLGAVFGPRRILVYGASLFAVASFLIPFSPNLSVLLALQVLGGLGSGTFIPLTIGFVLQNLPPRLWPYGIAAYGMSLELSLNVPASMEGFYLDNLDWRWIFWQGTILAVPMILCLRRGMPRASVNQDLLHAVDPWGMFYFGTGLAMVYAALDQGNRLDWLNSGLVVSLLVCGGILLVAFVAHELVSARPWLNLKFLFGRNIILLVVILALYRFALLATSYIIPQYLTTVQNFRSLETGQVLIWIAVPQFLIAPLIAWILGRVEPRAVLAIGVAIIGVACYWTTSLTPEWQTNEFLPSQILQAFGQSAALIALVLFFTRHLKPADALTFGAILQTGRLLGGELGTAFMQTFVRKAEQSDSYLVGLHVQAGTTFVNDRLAATAASLSAREGVAVAQQQASSLLGSAVRTQANVISFIDGFTVVTVAAMVMLVLIALLRRPPTSAPATPAPTGSS